MASSTSPDNIAVSLRPARVLENSGASEFQTLFCQAVEKSKDVALDNMHQEDRYLLKKLLHENPQLLSTSGRFHYVRFAELFDIQRDDIRTFQSALDVVDYISATKPDVCTVADILMKLEKSGKCFDTVRKLSEQIVKRS